MTTPVADRDPRSPRPATAARHQDLQDRLVTAAAAAIASEGLATVRARSLAEAVGCSVGAIYQVFPDLDALILAANGRTLAALAAVLDAVPQAGSPRDHIVGLACSYLDFAASHRRGWAALFQHQMPPDHPVTPAYAEQQRAAFRHIEQPLARLRPDLAEPDRALLARTLFSAVHGVVELGLDEKVAAMPLPLLRTQLTLLVTAITVGLAHQR